MKEYRILKVHEVLERLGYSKGNIIELEPIGEPFDARGSVFMEHLFNCISFRTDHPLCKNFDEYFLPFEEDKK